MIDERTPVIVGVGQQTFRDGVVEPLAVVSAAASAAIIDTGKADVIARLDACWVVNILSGPYAAPATLLADDLGLPPDGDRLSTTIGGNTPLALLARACDAITAGSARGVLIAGGEAGRSETMARRRGSTMDLTPERTGQVDRIVGDERRGVGDAELAIGLALPAHVYPWFESALAADAGRSGPEQRAWLGAFMARVGRRASLHPELSWFPEARTPQDIAEVTEDNRIVAEPYTKRMNSILAVDQGAAVIVVSAAEAGALGIDRDRWVFPWSGATCSDVFYPSARPDLGRSAGIAAAGRAALAAAHRGIDDIAFFDLYSCFPSAIQMGAAALGVDLDDDRELTLTGGMPAFGGPGNNYATHGLAMAVEALRRDPSALALTTGLGWYVTKHSVSIIGGTPPAGRWTHPSCSDQQAQIDATARPIATDASGPATIVAGTVIHDRERGPVKAPVLVDLPDGRRAVCGAVNEDAAAAVSGTDLVGMRVRLHRGEGAPMWEPAGD